MTISTMSSSSWLWLWMCYWSWCWCWCCYIPTTTLGFTLMVGHHPPTGSTTTTTTTTTSSSSSLTRVFLSASSSSKSPPVLLQQEQEQQQQQQQPHHPVATTPLELEFEQLLLDLTFDETHITAIPNPRLRDVFLGIAASYQEPAVYRAFQLLYHDYLPLRLAGRRIHSKLLEYMNDCLKYQHEQFDKIRKIFPFIVGLDNNDDNASLLQIWSWYCDWNHHYYHHSKHHHHNHNNNHNAKMISMDQVKSILQRAIQLNLLSNNDKEVESLWNQILSVVIAKMEEEQDHSEPPSTTTANTQRGLFFHRNNNKQQQVESSLTLSQLLLGLMEIGILSKQQHQDDTMIMIMTTLQELFRVDNNDNDTTTVSKSRTCQYNQQYDYMLQQFDQWKEYYNHHLPSDDSHSHSHSHSHHPTNNNNRRRWEILHGCFVGSENPNVVQALRVIYVDYAPLRVSGDFIFRLVSTLMKHKLPQQQ